jgi:hypothetical protein
MKDWAGIAQASGMTLSVDELERVAGPLGALEKAFRPLVKQLTPDMEPDLELRPDEDGE